MFTDVISSVHGISSLWSVEAFHDKAYSTFAIFPFRGWEARVFGPFWCQAGLPQRRVLLTTYLL